MVKTPFVPARSVAQALSVDYAGKVRRGIAGLAVVGFVLLASFGSTCWYFAYLTLTMSISMSISTCATALPYVA